MSFPFSLLVAAYFCGCLIVIFYLAYSLIRHHRLTERTAIGATVFLLPLVLLFILGLAEDDIDVNPLIRSSDQLEGTYSFGDESLTLASNGTFISTGLFSAPSGHWTLGTFTLNLSGTAISPRVVTCNGDICIAPYYDDVDGSIGVLLKRTPRAQTTNP